MDDPRRRRRAAQGTGKWRAVGVVKEEATYRGPRRRRRAARGVGSGAVDELLAESLILSEKRKKTFRIRK